MIKYLPNKSSPVIAAEWETWVFAIALLWEKLHPVLEYVQNYRKTTENDPLKATNHLPNILDSGWDALV